jgi:septum formation protein
MKRLVLASTSPRRKKLLESAGLAFECTASGYEEDMTLPLAPMELAKFLSLGKARAVAAQYTDAVVVGADTFVVDGAEVLGKPHTVERARKTLRQLSGRGHSIITGFSIIDTTTGREISKAVETTVHLKPLTEAEIDAYIATGEPLERAGAYAIQDLGGALIGEINGDYNNVVGLPLDAVLETLADFGIEKG